MSQLLTQDIGPDILPRRVPTGPEPVGPSLPEGIAAAIKSEWIGAWLFRRFQAAGESVDPNFDPFAGDGQQWRELTDGLDPDYWPSLGEARSMPQAILIREQLLGVQRSRQTLAQMGWTGTALQIGANIIDPVTLQAMLIPGAGPLTLGAKGGRLGFIARSGLAVGLPNAALESVRALEDPTYGPWQAATAGLAGFGFGAGTAIARGQGRLASALGGGLGQAAGTALGTVPDEDLTIKEALWSIGISGALGAPFGALSSRMHKEMELDLLKSLDAEISERGREYYKGIKPGRESPIQREIQAEIDSRVSDQRFARLEREYLADDSPIGFGPNDADTMPLDDAIPRETLAAATAPDAVTMGGGAGAASAGSISLSMYTQDEMYDFRPSTNDGPVKYAGARVGMSATMRSDATPKDIRAVASMTFDEAVGNADGSAVGDSAERAARRFQDVVITDYLRKTQGHVDAWMKANNVGFMGRRKAVDDLLTEVGRWQRRVGTHPDPNVAALVEAQRDAIMRVWAFGYRNGVPGFDRFVPSDLYLTRIWSLPAIHKAVTRYGTTEVVSTMADAIQRSQPNLSTREATVVAQSMLRDIIEAKSGFGLDIHSRYSASQAKELAAVIQANVPSATPDEISAVVAKFRRVEGEGVHARADFRVRLDETFRSGRTSLSIEDLLENNAFHVLQRYAREIGGAGAVSGVLRGYSQYIGRPPDRPIRTIDEMVREIKDRVISTDLNTNKANESKIATLAHMLSHIRGAPLNSGRRADFLRMLRKAQFSRVMNFAGLAQVPEVANAVTQAGWGTFVNAIPNLKQMFSKAADGTLSNAAAHEAEALMAHEAGTLRGSVLERMDWSDYEPQVTGPVERGLDRLNAVTRSISGMNGINRLLSRMVGTLAEQKMYDIAASGKLPNKARLAAMGMDDAMAKRVFGQIKKYGQVVPGTNAVKVLDPGAWDDVEAASHLILAMDRWSRRVVQQGDLGQMSAWMTKDWGQTLIQFRSFIIGAYEKHLLYPIANRDWPAFASWATTMFVGGITYVGATYAQAWGRPEQERRKFLAERLNLTTIGMGAFNRSGWSSIIPVAWDTTAQWSGAPSFSVSRMTGLGGDPLTGNPSTDYGMTLFYRLPKIAFRLATDGRAPTRGEARTIASLLPFQNAIGVRNVLNRLFGELREEPPR